MAGHFEKSDFYSEFDSVDQILSSFNMAVKPERSTVCIGKESFAMQYVIAFVNSACRFPLFSYGWHLTMVANIVGRPEH